MRIYEYKCFVIAKVGGADAPWVARSYHGTRLQAGTLQEAKAIITEFHKNRKKRS